jgi:Domain of unknown function (DUF4189)
MKSFVTIVSLALFFTALLPVGTAQAQATFICGNGPPGEVERQVGWTPAGPGVGANPLCVSDGPPAQEKSQQSLPPPRSREPTYETDSFFASVSHPDASDMWTSYNYFNEADAKKDAVSDCAKMMGRGCVVAVSGKNNELSIMRDSDGNVRWAVSNASGSGNNQIITTCRAEGKRCYEIRRVFSYPIKEIVGKKLSDRRSVENPKNDENLRNLYGAVAWIGEVGHPLSKNIWTASDHKTQADAEKAALGLCQQVFSNAPQSCKIAITNANGVIIVGMDSKKRIYFDSDVAVPDSWAALQAQCKSAKQKCKLKYMFEVRKPGGLVWDVLKS